MSAAAKHRLLAGLLLVTITTLWYTGLLSVLFTHDAYYLSRAIAAIGLGFYILAHFTLEHSKLGPDTVLTLGLIGTIVGFMIMIVGASETGDLYTKLPGASTALLTTLVGAFWGLVLRYQAWMQGERW